MGLEDYWAITFSSKRELSNDEMAEIAGKAGHSVGLVGQVSGQQRWDYNLYVNENQPLSEEGLRLIREKGMALFLWAQKYNDLVKKVFPNHKQELIEMFRNS